MTQATDQKPIVHMKCRRGHDRATEGQTCKGMQAQKMSEDGSQVAQFKCVTCGHLWGVPLGGYSPI